jgi:hypothetical protein
MIRRIGIICGWVAALCLAAALILPGSAQADRNGKVLLSVGAAPFTATPAGPLLDTQDLAPGSTISADLGVRSGFGVGTTLHIGLTDVRDDDNGCTPAEARVDHTCGVNGGDLGAALVMSVQLATTQSGRYHQVWQGSAADLARLHALPAAVPAHGERWLRISAVLPVSVGDIVQSDTIRFGVRVVLAGNGVRGGSGIDAIHIGGLHPATHGVDGLAATGADIVLFGVGAALLIVAGTMISVSARSSTGRRAPRPTSPRTACRARARVR